MVVPDIVFIVPYRDRKPQKKVFETLMSEFLENYNYQIFFLHQNDKRPFNRGAMKNIGFLYVKERWKDDYKNINLVFHDIDYLMYYKDQFIFETKQGVVKHFFGYKHTLGGIFSIKASDFESINGFPNIWTWGLEDNIIQIRAQKHGLIPDYSQFIQAGLDEKKLICLWHGWNRLIDNRIGPKYDAKTTYDGIEIIKNLKYDVENISNKASMININNFETGESHLLYKTAKETHSLYNKVFDRRKSTKKNRLGGMNFHLK